MAISYQDFDLTIQKSDDGYLAWLDSPAGQARTIFKQPFSESELKEYLPHFGRGAAKRMRGAERSEAKIAEELGNRLFEAVFEGDVRDCLRGSLDEAARRGSGLRIRLHLMAVPELSDLPWEFLYNASLRRFFALSVDTPVVRYLEVPESIRPLALTLPLRVLVMISSPTDYPTLDVEKEWSKLNEAMGRLQSQNLVALDRLDIATLSSLQRRLRASQYHIFHYVGHGAFNQETQDGELVLEDEQKQGCLVSGRDLGMLLHDHHPMRLVVLNSCEGARISSIDPFGGTAQSLVLQGIPAVLAMQFEISDEAAITICREFYGALADGYPVDAALTEARKALYSQGNYLEWGTPVLYMRSPDGRIFDLAKEPPKRDSSALFREAQVAIDTGNWGEAIRTLQQTLSVDPQHRDAQAALKYAQQMEEATALYQDGERLQKVGDLEGALVKYRRVRETVGNYRNVDATIAQIEERMRAGAAATPPAWKPPAFAGAFAPLKAAAAPAEGRRRISRRGILLLISLFALIAVGIVIAMMLRPRTTIVTTSNRVSNTDAMQGAKRRPRAPTLNPPFDAVVIQDEPAEVFLRTDPKSSSSVIAKLLRGSRLGVTGPSVEADGLRWWPAIIEKGWVAEVAVDQTGPRLIESVDRRPVSMNREVKVTDLDPNGLNLRRSPNGQQIIARLPWGTSMVVVGDPQVSGRFIWWPVEVRHGWIVDGPIDGSNPVIRAITP